MDLRDSSNYIVVERVSGDEDDGYTLTVRRTGWDGVGGASAEIERTTDHPSIEKALEAASVQWHDLGRQADVVAVGASVEDAREEP